MNDSQIQDILTDVDRMVRERLAAAGFEIPHAIVAIPPMEPASCAAMWGRPSCGTWETS